MSLHAIVRRLTSIPDDRGQRIPLRRAGRAQLELSTSRSARWVLASRPYIIGLASVCMAAVGVRAGLYAIQLGRAIGAPMIESQGYFLLGTFPVVAVGGPLIWLAGCRWRAGTLVTRMRRAHLCSGCGYSLADLPRDADGLTTCPECACAWSLPPERRRADAPAPIALRPRARLINRIRIALSFPDAAGQRWSNSHPAAQRYKRLTRSRRTSHNLVWGLGGLLIFVVLQLGGLLAITAAAGAMIGHEAAAQNRFVENIVPPASLLIAAAGTAVIILLITAEDRRRYVRQLLAASICPACGACLTPTPEHPHTTCQDCGAVWECPPHTDPTPHPQTTQP